MVTPHETHSVPKNYYLAFFIVLLALCACTLWLMSNDYVNEYSLSRWAKVLAILDAPEIRLEHLGLVYPHFPIYVLMPFYYLPGLNSAAAPYLAATLIGVLLLMLWNHHLTQKRYTFSIRVLFILLVASHPYFLWAVTSNTQHALSLLMFYLLYLSVARLLNEQDVRSFLMLGLVLAIYFFVDDRTFYLFIALLPLLPLIAPKKMLDESVSSVYLIIATPLLIAIAAWAYLNWIFVDDPLLFLTSPESTFRGAWLDTPHVQWLKTYGGSWLAPSLIAVFMSMLAYPILVWMLLHTSGHTLLLRATFVLLLHPLLATGLATLNYYLAHPVYMVFLFSSGVMAGLVLLPRQPPVSKKMILVMLLLSSIGGWFTFAYNPTHEMQVWLNAIQGRSSEYSHQADMALGIWLKENRQTTLIDDHIGYRAIVARGDAKNLILPYSQAFKLALRKRDPDIAQIVVTNPRRAQGAEDVLHQHFPLLYERGMLGYALVYDHQHWRVYRQKSKRTM
jgi:membrane protein XagC